MAYHGHEGAPPAGPRRRWGPGAPPGPAGGPGRVLRAGRPGPLPVHRAHVRGPGPGGRGGGTGALRAAGRRRAGRRRHPGRGAIAGIDEVYRIGGAQAIAAMAYGTGSVPRVDVIVGPGNAYVAEAKRQVSGVVGVASAFAGPSEIVVVAGPDRRRRPSPPSTWWSRPSTGPTGWPGWSPGTPTLLEAVVAEIARLVATSPRRADLEATLATGGHRLPGRRPGGGARRLPTRSPPSTWS